VGVEIDGGRQQMRAFAEAGQRGRKYFVAAAGEQPGNPAPAPGAVPGSVNQNECRHVSSLRPVFCAVSMPLVEQCIFSKLFTSRLRRELAAGRTKLEENDGGVYPRIFGSGHGPSAEPSAKNA
jgi:hypothetical protein